jgi:hypothetical protein
MNASLSLHGLTAVSISNFANGACGEQRRHDSDGIRLEIDAPRWRSRIRMHRKGIGKPRGNSRSRIQTTFSARQQFPTTVTEASPPRSDGTL